MKINNKRLDRIISKLTIEYNGCHAPWSDTPLYGRNAYWRIYINNTFVAKITAPVKSMQPRNNTLQKLFKSALKKRLERIRKAILIDDYGYEYRRKLDPSSLRSLIPLALE
jgi:hypothetical protein